MNNRNYLQIPGPTNVPEPIMRSMATPMINQRGPEFKALLDYNIAGLKDLLRTTGDILIFPSSGSGGLEATIVNLFSKGDTIISVDQGVFSQRYGKIARVHGVKVLEIVKELGQPIMPEDVEALLMKDTEKKIKAVCLPQNETATGVANDIPAIAQVIKKLDHPALLVVDGVSSIACVPFEMDEWGVDVAITASQKGLMLPPGLGIVAINAKAWRHVEEADLPRWYWDFTAVKDSVAQGFFPYTPATSLFFALQVSLDMLNQEGIENVWARHKRNSYIIREAGKAMGLKLLADEAYASHTVTAFFLPDGIDYTALDGVMQEKYHVVLGGGLGELKGKIFRIGHLGALELGEVFAIMNSLELGLQSLGITIPPGTAAKAINHSLNALDY